MKKVTIEGNIASSTAFVQLRKTYNPTFFDTRQMYWIKELNERTMGSLAFKGILIPHFINLSILKMPRI